MLTYHVTYLPGGERRTTFLEPTRKDGASPSSFCLLGRESNNTQSTKSSSGKLKRRRVEAQS